MRYYIRYADDFVVLHPDKSYLVKLIPVFSVFLKRELKLSMHPSKVYIKTLAGGVDFLGWVHFPHHRVLRTSTKRRMVRRLQTHRSRESFASYRGLLKHGNTHKLVQQVEKFDKMHSSMPT